MNKSNEIQNNVLLGKFTNNPTKIFILGLNLVLNREYKQIEGVADDVDDEGNLINYFSCNSDYGMKYITDELREIVSNTYKIKYILS